MEVVHLSPSNAYVLSNLDRMDVHALDYISLFLLLLLNFKENSCQYGSSLNLQNAGMKTKSFSQKKISKTKIFLHFLIASVFYMIYGF